MLRKQNTFSRALKIGFPPEFNRAIEVTTLEGDAEPDHNEYDIARTRKGLN